MMHWFLISLIPADGQPGTELKDLLCKAQNNVPRIPFEIRNAHYKVRGYTETLGCVASLDRLATASVGRRGTKSGRHSDEGLSMVVGELDDKGVRPFCYPLQGTSVKMNTVNRILHKNAIEWEQKKENWCNREIHF